MVGPRCKPGRMGPYVVAYQSWLAENRYTPGTIRNIQKVLSDFGRWLEQQDVEPRDVDAGALERFQESCCRRGMLRPPTMRSLRRCVLS